MTDKKTLKYFIINLLDDMKRMGDRSYSRSMRTILKGSSGPVADKFQDSTAYGKAPYITMDELREVMDELVYTSEVIQMMTSSGKIYYLKLSSAYVDDRLLFNELFGVPQEFNTDSLTDELDYYPSRNPMDYDAYSEKGSIDVKTINGTNKSIQYESSIERKLIDKLIEIEYVKDIVEQPIEIPKGINGDKHYTPDLLIKTYHNYNVLIEVKSYDEMTTYSVLRNYESLKNYAYQNEMLPALVTLSEKHWISLKDIKNAPTNIHLETLVLDKIHRYGKITDKEYKEIIQKIDVGAIDIHHIIVKNNLKKKGKWDNYYIEK
ncbi:MAG TPA: hypothetical protein PLJ98_07395 [Acholeplasmataceae bacterium]|nr:hypothetical protein [Acholeplasmataceae bacterium]